MQRNGTTAAVEAGPENGSTLSVRERRADEAEKVVTRRYDFGGALLKATRRTSDGALLAEGVLVREGILDYRRADGSIRKELVTMAAVKDTARTGARAPVTLLHPDEGFVNADSAKELVIGDVDGEVAVEEDAQGGFARIKIAVRRRDGLDATGAGVHELSPGYEVILDETPGEDPRFGRYDARQIGRDVNHVAIVPQGRGGPSVSLRIDSADAVQVEPTNQAVEQPDQNRKDSMKPKLAALLSLLGVAAGRFDNEDAALDDGLANAKGIIEAKAKTDAEEEEKAKADLKAEDGAFGKMKKDLEKMTGERDALKTENEDLKAASKKKSDAEDLAAMQILADKVKVDHKDLDLQALRLAVAKTRVDSVDTETSDDRLDGILDVIRGDSSQSEAKDSRFDFRPKDDADKRADSKEDDFYNPHLDAADEARAPGGAK